MRETRRELREMTAPAIHASRNAARALIPFAKSAALIVAVAVFLTLTDAFGLEVLSFGPRLLYWLVLLGIGRTVALLIRLSMDRLQLSPTRLILTGALRCFLASLVVTVIVWLVTSLALSLPLRAAWLPQLYIPVLVITAAMVCLSLLAQRQPFETHAKVMGATPDAVAPPAPILARFPIKLRMARLYAVQAEDHYIRIYTSAGSDLILLRFSDALGELRGIEGAQVHRSWWVARDAVTSSTRKNEKLFLVLRDDTNAPVSRSYARALQSEGWL